MMPNPQQTAKNWALLGVLVALVVILFVITLLRYDGARLAG